MHAAQRAEVWAEVSSCSAAGKTSRYQSPVDCFGSLCFLPASAAAANKEVKQILEQSKTGGSDEGNDTTPTSKRRKYEHFTQPRRGGSLERQSPLRTLFVVSCLCSWVWRGGDKLRPHPQMHVARGARGPCAKVFSAKSFQSFLPRKIPAIRYM